MAIDVYWGSGSPFAWRVLLALEHKRLPYVSHVLQFSKQEHKSPQMLALNPRGKVPVLKDGDYVCFESLAILYYLDLKYPEPPIFGRTPGGSGHHHAGHLRVPGVHRAAREHHRARGVLGSNGDLGADAITGAMHTLAERGAHHRGTAVEVRLDRGRCVLGGRHGDLSRHPAAAARAGEAARRASCPRASCRWR